MLLSSAVRPAWRWRWRMKASWTSRLTFGEKYPDCSGSALPTCCNSHSLGLSCARWVYLKLALNYVVGAAACGFCVINVNLSSVSANICNLYVSFQKVGHRWNWREQAGWQRELILSSLHHHRVPFIQRRSVWSQFLLSNSCFQQFCIVNCQNCSHSDLLLPVTDLLNVAFENSRLLNQHKSPKRKKQIWFFVCVCVCVLWVLTPLDEYFWQYAQTPVMTNEHIFPPSISGSERRWRLALPGTLRLSGRACLTASASTRLT